MRLKRLLNTMNKNLYTLFMVCLFLVACSSSSIKPEREPVDEIEVKPSIPVIETPEQVSKPGYEMKPVVVSLLKKAGHRMDAEDYDAAANFLERGISISPNNPVLWQELATVRLKQGDFYQAEQLAVKSNVLGEANNELRDRKSVV